MTTTMMTTMMMMMMMMMMMGFRFNRIPTFAQLSLPLPAPLCRLQVFPAPYETRCDSATWTTSSWNVTSYLHQQSWKSNWARLWWIAGWDFWDNFHSQNANVESEDFGLAKSVFEKLWVLYTWVVTIAGRGLGGRWRGTNPAYVHLIQCKKRNWLHFCDRIILPYLTGESHTHLDHGRTQLSYSEINFLCNHNVGGIAIISGIILRNTRINQLSPVSIVKDRASHKCTY